jgi:hypothetical protein
MSCAAGYDCSCQSIGGSTAVVDVVYLNGGEAPSTACFCNEIISTSFGPPWPWWHLAGFYSDPALAGDGYFYFVITYYVRKGAACVGQGEWSGGVMMFRVHIDFSDDYGLGALQIYHKDPLTGVPSFQPFSGVVPQALNCQADLRHYLIVEDCNDPQELFIVRDGDGNFDSLVLSCSDWRPQGEKPVLYVAHQIKHPFSFGPKRDFVVCGLGEAGYVSCGGGSVSWHMGLLQPPNEPPWQSFYDPATKAPLKLLGYFSAGKLNSCCYPTGGGCDCSRNSQGLAYAEISLGTQNTLGEVGDLRLQKDAGGKIRLNWGWYPGVKYNIADGDLDTLRQGIYTHRRRECGVSQVFKILEPLPSNAYYLLTPQCGAGSEGSFGRASSGIEIPHATGVCIQRYGGLP